MSSTESEFDDDDDSEVIELTGCGTISHWRLPKEITKCPIRNCDKQFNARLDLINHYKECHAKHSVYCKICHKAIISQGINNFKRHYARVHPNENCPLDIDDPKPTHLSKVQQLTLFYIL